MGLVGELKSIFGQRKKRFLFAILMSQVVPVLELGVLFSVFLVLRPDDLERVIAKLGDYGLSLSSAALLDGLNSRYFIVGTNLFFILGLYFSKHWAENNLARLQYDAYSNLTKKLVTSFLRLGRGRAEKIGKDRLVDSILNDAAVFADLLKQLLAFMGSCLSLSIFLVVTARISLPLLAVSALIYLLPVYLGRGVYEQLSKIGKRKVENQEQMLSFFTDVMRGFDRIKLDRLSDILGSVADQIVMDSKSWREEKRSRLTGHNIFNDTFAIAGLLFTVCAGTWWFSVSTESLLFLIATFSRARVHFGGMSYAYAQIRLDLPHAYRYLALSTELKEARVDARARVVNHIEGPLPIKFEKVSLRYEDKQVLQISDLTIKPGERILITGPSGSGKSTILKTLSNLHEGNGGKISIGGIDINTLSRDFFSKHIFYCSPDLHILNLSWNENINSSNLASLAIAREALREVELLDEVGLTDDAALNEKIPENGDRLSLGQRHRLLLARLFSNSHKKIILLDEMTTNLNPDLEERIIGRINQAIPKDAIVILASHRPPKNFHYSRHFFVERGELFLG